MASAPDEARTASAAAFPDGPRGELVARLPPGAADRGVYVLEPQAPEYPGSPFDLLLPTASASLLVEAKQGPVVAVAGLAADVAVPEQADVVDLPGAGRTAVAGPSVDPVDAGDPLLARLAATAAPFGWVGRVDGVDVLVTLEGDALRAELDGADAATVRRTLAGSLPGSPGKRWADVVDDVVVREDGDRVVVTARATALPPALLRTVLDGLVR